MKKIALIFTMAFITGIAFSQEYLPTPQEIDAFYNTKTYVVLEDNPMLDYNIIVKEVMKKEWKLTPYDFISWAEFEEMRKDPKNSFLVLTKVNFEKDKTMATYKFVNLLLGGNYFGISQMPALCSFPLSYHGVEESSYNYKLANLLRFVQNHVELIKAKPDIVSRNVFKYYNDNMADIKSKTLYVVQDELEPEVNSAARIKNVYPYRFKIVTRQDVQDAIERRDPNVVYLHKVGPEGTRLNARCYKIIVGAADANLYYFDFHMIDDKKPDGLLEKDFKKLSKG